MPVSEDNESLKIKLLPHFCSYSYTYLVQDQSGRQTILELQRLTLSPD